MDREKVIKDLEECMTASCRGYRPRLSCPYNDEEWDIMRDALALLKEQEAKKVLQIRNVAYRTIGYCPSCGRGLDSYEDGNSGEHITNYCYNCGQAVKWE